MHTTPDHDMSGPRERARSARELRNLYRYYIRENKMSLADVIKAATKDGNRALLKLHLHEMLTDQPHWGHQRAKNYLAKLADVLEARDGVPGVPLRPKKGKQKSVKESNHKTTPARLGWLVDPRAHQRRLAAWAALETANELPWRGFPWTPEPPIEQPTSSAATEHATPTPTKHPQTATPPSAAGPAPSSTAPRRRRPAVLPDNMKDRTSPHPASDDGALPSTPQPAPPTGTADGPDNIARRTIQGRKRRVYLPDNFK